MRKNFEFLFSILLFHFVYYSSLAIPSCPPDQSLVLLTFKESLSIEHYNSHLYCQSLYPKTMFWNTSTDCCTWDGVTCDETTSNIIELDLSCGHLDGSIDSDSSLFQLHHLQSLNLAYNRIKASKISMIFGNFTHLAHLNLSNNDFSGEVPSEILKLTELSSLDLSSNAFTVRPDIFKLLLTNFTKLSQVYLPNLDILSSIPNNLSSSLENLQLRRNNLHGELPLSIFHLPNLNTLDVGENSELYGLLPSVKWNSHRTLEWLDLSGTQFSGNIPDSFRNLQALKYLDLSRCGFSGVLPERIFSNMPQIETIRLSSNRLIGSLPSFPREIKHLNELSLCYNSFSGTIKPSWLLSLSSLQWLQLCINKLTGPVPMELSNLVNLQGLFLENNQLSGHIPTELSSLVNLQSLYLLSNNFNGHVPMELSRLSNLQRMVLSYNQLSGPVPTEFSGLANLQNLELSSNNFSGHVDVDIFSNMKQLRVLRLSHNKLSLVSKSNSALPESIELLQLASCNITELDFLPSAPKFLDLSMNHIKEVPSWLWSKWKNILELNISYNSITHVGEIQFQQIGLLDIRSNLFRGKFPQVPPTIVWMFISNNQFSGTISSSRVCSLSNLALLDLSNNSFTGSIPQCIGNMSRSLNVLDMSMNKFEGTIPTNISSMMLTTLNLRGNHLGGNMPLSLATCMNLRVLDLGNNNLNDLFPYWLGVIPNLTVLSLRFNNFHGKIILSATSSFSKLQILDLSHNHFIGTISPELFNTFTGMMQINETNGSPSYMGNGYSIVYEDSTTLMNKGTEVDLEKIFKTWSIIDLSSNKFEGNIPNSVGRLISVRQMNFSNNMLRGEIPISFGNLPVLESLDLSSNQLTGIIPTQLTTLHFLSKLNLSHNHLTGQIPVGPQFQTFENNSYVGNDGLCGIPLSKTCGGDQEHVVDNSHDSEFFDGFGWRCVLIGYGVGIVIGSWIGFLMIFTGTPNQFIRMIEKQEYRIVMRRDRKKKIIQRNARNN